MKTLSLIYFKTRLLTGFSLILASLLLAACGQSEEKLCIDKQSHLWNNATNDKNANKAYWDAVAKCKEP